MRKPSEIPDLKDMIDQADADLLRDFLWHQVKRSSALALKLRAHLVENTEAPRGFNKYSQVLSLLVRHDVQGKIRLTGRSLQLLRDICAHFVRLQQQHLHAGELRDAYEAGISVIIHLHLLMDKYHGPDPKLVAILTECYALTHTLLHLHPAPELARTIYTELRDVVKRNHHLIYELEHNAITCLLVASPSDDTSDEISELVIEKINQTRDTNESLHKMWCALLLKVPGAHIDISMHIRHDQVYDIAYMLYATKDNETLGRLLAVFEPDANLSRGQLQQWTKWKFELAISAHDRKEILRQGIRLLQLDQDIHTYRRMKAHVPQQSLIVQIADLDIPDGLHGDILAEDEEWDALAALLRKTHNLSLLIRHCPAIIGKESKPASLITEVVDGYAVHHGGSKSVEQVGQLIDLLVNLKQHSLAVHLAEHLKSEFPGRFDAVLKRKALRRSAGPESPDPQDEPPSASY